MPKMSRFEGMQKKEYTLIFWLWQADKFLLLNKINCFASCKQIYLKPYLKYSVYEFMSDRSALIIGATGLVGKSLVKQILDDYSYGKVKVAVRKKLPLEHHKLEQHIIDFDNIQSISEIFEADDIFCCIGTTIKKAGSQEAFIKVDYSYAFEAAKNGVLNGANQFLLISAIGADSDSSIFYKRVKGDIEDSVSKLGYNAVKILRPSLLVGQREENRLGEKIGIIVMKILSVFLAGKYKKFRAIKAESVAKAMLAIAKNDTEGVSVYESDEIQSISERKWASA